jgi:catechol 2,3-dioxygenase-like lactoylglutathione lyase family enzyme
MTSGAKLNTKIANNIELTVPFFHVRNIENSVRFYTEGLGFEMKKQWTPNGTLQWCWLERDSAAIMLQEFRTGGHDSRPPLNNPGEGVSINYQCKDALALYREFTSRGIHATEPEVGNNMWVTIVTDPDGYKLDFESATDVPEDTKLSAWNPGN